MKGTYSIVKLLIKKDNMTNMKVKSNMNKQNEKKLKSKGQNENNHKL